MNDNRKFADGILCPNCGNKVFEDSNDIRCPKCGKSFKENELDKMGV